MPKTLFWAVEILSYIIHCQTNSWNPPPTSVPNSIQLCSSRFQGTAVGQLRSLVFWDVAQHWVQEELFLDYLTHEDGSDTLPQNVGNKLPTYITQHPRWEKTSSLIIHHVSCQGKLQDKTSQCQFHHIQMHYFKQPHITQLWYQAHMQLRILCIPSLHIFFF